jgi:very-short-patch-repair endonuclease
VLANPKLAPLQTSPLLPGEGSGVRFRMPIPHIVIGQKVETGKVVRARELRRAMTPEERLLWQRLRGNQLDGLHFRRQQVIDGYIADFYCHAAAVIVEVDGAVHAEQEEYDSARDQILWMRGFRILRVANEEVRRDLDGVLRQIAVFCRGGT